MASPLGSELSLKDDPALGSARELAVEFHGTAPVAQLDIIRNNKVVHSRPGNGQMDLSIAWQDAEPIARRGCLPRSSASIRSCSTTCG